MNRKNLLTKFVGWLLSASLVFALIVPCLMTSASANNVVYEDAYNIYDMIGYADEYTDYEGDLNPSYRFYDKDCTNFVCQCISVAGGIPQEGYFAPDSSGKPHYHPWTVPADLFYYLTQEKGYNSSSFSRGYSIDHEKNEASVWVSGNVEISVGDVVFFDFGSGIKHAAVIVGYNSSGVPCYAGHTNNRWMYPLWDVVVDLGYSWTTSCTYYIVHMTDATGFTDVTSRYVGKKVAIKSIEVGQYISSDTNQNVDTVDAVANRNTASTWEYFDVIANKYGSIGFKSHANSNYLSSRIDLNSTSAPVRAAYGQNYTEPQSWESFRIYEKDGIQYIQSQANGKWVQVVANESSHPIKASARAASTWEQFSIEVIG